MGKTGTTPGPHDAIFKKFLTRVDTARDFLQLHLPAELLALCDLSTLTLTSGAFVEDDLRPYYSDVLYSLTAAGDAGYIYVLIEHQSTPEPLMPFRLMRYAIAAMQRHLDAGHHRLPLVIPVLFYAGLRRPYPWAVNWLEGFSLPDQARRLYTSDFPLVDVTVIADDDIMHHRSMATLTLLQKHIRQRDLAGLLDRLVTLLRPGHISEEQIVALINYIFNAGSASDADALVRKLAQQVPRYGEKIMLTLAEHFEQKGVKKGIEQGIEQGEREATRKIARTMLLRGLDAATVMAVTGLTASDIAKLQET